MQDISVLDALVAFLFWVCIAAAIGVFVGKAFRLGDPRRECDPEEGRLVDMDSERRRRRRGDVRNGMDGAA
jgi:hypothetical protein